MKVYVYGCDRCEKRFAVTEHPDSCPYCLYDMIIEPPLKQFDLDEEET